MSVIGRDDMIKNFNEYRYKNNFYPLPAGFQSKTVSFLQRNRIYSWFLHSRIYQSTI